MTAWQTFLGLAAAGAVLLRCFEIVSQQQHKGCIGTLTSAAVDDWRPVPALLVNWPSCTTTALQPPQCLLHPPVRCRISQLRPKIGLRTWGPPCRLIGFLIVCLAIGSAPMHQICNRSICGPARQPMQFQTKYGQTPQFCIQMGKK